MFRIYNIKDKAWECSDDFLIAYNDDLYMRKRKMFGIENFELVPNGKYAVHYCTNAYDKLGNLIYEGDICEINLGNDKDEAVIGVVGYAPWRAAYFIVEDGKEANYQFNTEMLSYTTVIGNVFDNKKQYAAEVRNA